MLVANDYDGISYLGSGSSCDVWIADTSIGKIVVRFLHTRNGKTPIVSMDADLRRILHAKGAAVAKPIATSLVFAEASFPTPWIIDEYIVGAAPERRKLSKRVCYDLGEVLRCLHAIPATGFGWPIWETTLFEGKTGSAYEGLTQRFDDSWPMSQLALAEHPIGQTAPQFIKALSQVKDDILKLLGSSTSSIVHSDLHERQLICRADRLAAVIDFGDAMISDPAWDLASLYYFHGAQALNDTLQSYALNADEAKSLLHRAKLFSIPIACHHAKRSAVLNKLHRMQAAIAHLQSVFQCL